MSDGNHGSERLRSHEIGEVGIIWQTAGVAAKRRRGEPVVFLPVLLVIPAKAGIWGEIGSGWSCALPVAIFGVAEGSDR